jgi:DNA polymerase III alpha subunit
MGKKDPAEMAKQRDRFVSGATEKKFPKDKVVRIFDLMEQFAGYGFNKSHSAAYAILAYQTAYLKTHYPVEFMSALLTSEISKPENVVKYIKECREMDIRVEPPDVLFSDADFTPHGAAIRFGLTAIKNVGRNAIDSILAARQELAEQNKSFATYWEFCEKVDLRLMNKRVLESLVKAGALDSFGRRSPRRRSATTRPASMDSSASSTPSRTPRRAPTSSPTFPTGTRISACNRRKRCWASSSPAIRSISTPRSCATYPEWSTPQPPRR